MSISNSAIGCDLGEVQDFSALATVRQVGDGFQCTYLDRPPLGTSYERVNAVIAQIMEKPAYEDTTLVVDATGVGRPVVERMEDIGLNPIPVVITGGVNEIHEPGDWAWRVPKKNLVTVAQICFQRGLIKMPHDHKLAKIAEQEIRNFKRKQNPVTMNDSFEAGREGQHDDIMLALCLALWQVTKYYEPVQISLAKTINTTDWLGERQKRDYEELLQRMNRTPEENDAQRWLDRDVEW
jgi:hypothetical protein